VQTLEVDFLKGGNLKAILTRNGYELIKWPSIQKKATTKPTQDTSPLPDTLEPDDGLDAETRARLDRKNKLRTIGLALHNYEGFNSGFPSASTDHEGKGNGLSWRVHLLPFVGEAALYDKFRLNEPWDSFHNRKLIASIPEAYKSYIVSKEGHTTLQVVVGDDTAFPIERPLKIRDMTDGLTNTGFVVDVAPERASIWTKPGGIKLDAKQPLKSLGTPYPYGFMILMGDGAVKYLDTEFLKNGTLEAIFTRNGGERIAWP